MRKRKDPSIRQSVFLDAAEELFFSKGYEQTSITDILKAVGDASPSVFYYYFSSKEELFKATMKRYVEIHNEETINELLSEPNYTIEEIEKVVSMTQTTILDFEKVDGYFNETTSDASQFHQVLMEESIHILQKPLQKYIETMRKKGAVQETPFLREAGTETVTSVFLHAVFALFHDNMAHTNAKLQLIPLLVSQLIGLPSDQ
jgi:AcrR family transcriptional regulator